MGLRVLIIGGGLAGLATALVLRRSAHQVQVFEASQLEFSDTVGPLVHIGPKSNELLQQWQFDAAVARGVLVKEAPEFNFDGTLQTKNESQPPGWVYYERSRLHRALLDSCRAVEEVGQPVKISLGTRVTAVDGETASITLDDGQLIQGDVVIGADGFHSTARQNIASKSPPGPSGPPTVAVHFKVDVTQLGRNSVVQRFKSEPQRYEKWIGAGLELKVSAVEPESLLLFDCNFQSAPPTSDLIKDIILKTFESACPDFTQLLTAIKPRDVYFWTQPSLPRVQRWTFGRLALVGDAAHPFLPHELPGTAQTLNDAAALGTQLSYSIGVEEVPARLAAWETPRQDRVKTIQRGERPWLG